MQKNRPLLITFSLFILCLHFSNLMASESSIKRRLEKHVEAMMDGQKSPLIKTKDYYSVIYQCTSIKVENLELMPNNMYRANLNCQSQAKNIQSFDGGEKVQEILETKEIISRVVTFIPRESHLEFHKKLSAPFVKIGSEKRYLVPNSRK